MDAAGLTHTIADGGPFTVLAPTDEAFGRLPEGTVESLLQEENLPKLAEILKYHVISGRVTASQVKNLRSAETLEGQRVGISHETGKIKINDATVISADIRASNGIIHVIDAVLLPESKSIPEIAEGAGVFNTLLAAVGAAGLGSTLTEGGPFTVFAPTDDAFARLPDGTVESLLQEENLPKLAEILKYHVVSGRVYADQALEARRASTLAGIPVQIRVSDGTLRVNDSQITATDIQASNGVVHVIDAVLLPPEMSPKQQAARELMSLAIERGVPLFNNGQAEACAAIYEVAATALLHMGDAIPQDAQRELRRSLRASQRTHDMSDRAWTLRNALDETMRQMSREMGR
ncbi:MAG: fasciclin domain-containing protein [Gemmatimonadetes bacterium]|nr:fasciclin domain-containing protein [Gemmatimonadota bacterium]